MDSKLYNTKELIDRGYTAQSIDEIQMENNRSNDIYSNERKK